MLPAPWRIERGGDGRNRHGEQRHQPSTSVPAGYADIGEPARALRRSARASGHSKLDQRHDQEHAGKYREPDKSVALADETVHAKETMRIG